jgi:hypothetical protein
VIRDFIWRAVAFVVSRPAIVERLIKRAQRTPYSHIQSMDGADVYMYRWWVFNPYGKDAADEITPPRWPRLPSIRVHHIIRPDLDRHLHDHPWNARTIVLRGAYAEERSDHAIYPRVTGYTGRLLYQQYHRITSISTGGVFTLFFTWRKRGTWGYLVDGQKVPHRQYPGWVSGKDGSA